MEHNTFLNILHKPGLGKALVIGARSFFIICTVLT